MVEEFQKEYVFNTFDALVKRIDELENKIKDFEAKATKTAEADARRSSIEVGTPAKGGSIKAYVDPFGDPKKNDEAIAEMVRLLRLAGGTPTAPTGGA